MTCVSENEVQRRLVMDVVSVNPSIFVPIGLYSSSIHPWSGRSEWILPCDSDSPSWRWRLETGEGGKGQSTTWSWNSQPHTPNSIPPRPPHARQFHALINSTRVVSIPNATLQSPLAKVATLENRSMVFLRAFGFSLGFVRFGGLMGDPDPPPILATGSLVRERNFARILKILH